MCIRDRIRVDLDGNVDMIDRVCPYSEEGKALLGAIGAVSYTHLDVYKRQVIIKVTVPAKRMISAAVTSP